MSAVSSSTAQELKSGLWTISNSIVVDEESGRGCLESPMILLMWTPSQNTDQGLGSLFEKSVALLKEEMSDRAICLSNNKNHIPNQNRDSAPIKGSHIHPWQAGLDSWQPE